MNILVVDDNAESVADLANGLRAATAHKIITAVGADEALAVSQNGNTPDVLISEVVLPSGDGFSLRESLRQVRPALRTIYITGYDLSEYQDYLNGAPVFYKPVSVEQLVGEISRGEPAAAAPVAAAAAAAAPIPVAAAWPNASESGPVFGKSPSLTDELPSDRRSQSAKLRHLVQKQGFTGKLDQFELVDIIQMCCISKRTGRLQISHRNERGTIYLRGGQITHAINGPREGEEAVYEIIGWSAGQFNFEEGMQPDTETVAGNGWEHLIMEGVRRRDERNQAAAVAEGERVDASLTGQSIGPYRLRRKIGQGEHSQVFEALQTSMNRVVALKVLLPELQSDEVAVQTFLAEASAKANVTHPSILAVYEAGQSDGIIYYAREYVDGSSLTDLRTQGRTIDDAAALKLVRVATQALSYMTQQKIAHPPITSDALYLGRDGHPRLNNIATLPEVKSPAAQVDIRALSRIVSDCLPNRTATTPELRALLGRMLLDGANGFQSWIALLQAVRTQEPKVVPQDAFKLSAQDAVAAAAVAAAKKRQKTAVLWSTVGMFSIFWLIAGVVYFKFFRAPTVMHFDKLVEIPAGEFIFGEKGEKVTLPKFWIDQYEVTIGEYGEFIAELKKNPTTKYDHPNQPKGKAHDSTAWQQLYKTAASESLFNGSKVDLSCPAAYVDWFDAYAYAKWKGRRLPTEQEWEKAGRGTDGRRYPWGADGTAISKVNTGLDFHEDGHIKADSDGYTRWAPVDAMTGDKSPYGVMGMAGNVSEWTGTIVHKGALEYPIVRGGNFGSPDVEVTRRNDKIPDQTVVDRLGFRTVSDTPPPAK